MAKEKTQIRLPELPLFKKFSLVLRQEFANADEILGLVEKTTTRIHKLVQKAEDERRREEAAAAAEPVVEELTEDEDLEEYEEEIEDEDALEDEAVYEAEAGPEETDDQGGLGDTVGAEEDSREPAGADEDWRFPVDDDLQIDVTDDKPFWVDSDESGRSKGRRKAPAKKKGSRTRTTSKKAAPQIVRVGAKGTPLGKSRKSSAKPRTRSTSAKKKTSSSKSRGRSPASRKR